VCSSDLMLRPSQLIRETPLGQELSEEGRAQGEAEGRLEGQFQGRLLQARGVLLNLGVEKLGPVDSTTARAIDGINEVDVLDRLILRVLRATTWQELLAQADS